MAIHPTAIVDAKADVHEHASIGPFCVVGAGVRLHAGVELRNHATVFGGTTIHSGTIVFPGAVVGGDPQSVHFDNEPSEVIIGHNCRIHECVTINKGTAGGGMKTVVGDNCMIMAYAHIAHDCHLQDSIVVCNNAQLAGHVSVGRKAVISGMVGVHHFVSIGELAFVAAMSGVRKDVPPYVMVEGYPAEVRGLNIIGLRRDGWGREEVEAMKEAFRMIFHDKSRPKSEAIEELNGSPICKVKPVSLLSHWMTEHLTEARKGRLAEARR
ncbi:MAG: acyl-ACP--UDP-N-acetylglucosamine O-acyltransferase [Planctomycetota bacterium]